MQIPWNQKAYAGVLLEAVTGRRWLDIGCGRRVLPVEFSALEARARDSARICVGVDVNMASLRSNPAKMKVCADAAKLPFRDSEFDIATANMVMEHAAHPAPVLGEVSRVLSPGGVFLVHTPSARQYEILAARSLRLLLGATLFKRLVAAWEGREPEDIFPTRYGFNTPRTIKRLTQSRFKGRMAVQYAQTPPLLVRWKRLASAELILRRFLPSGAKAAMIVSLSKGSPAPAGDK